MVRRCNVWVLVLLAYCGPILAIGSDTFANPKESGVIVAFPGPAPGKAEAAEHNGLFTLQNQVISASWQFGDHSLHCTDLSNKLTGSHYDQNSAELFRLATQPTVKAIAPGVSVMVRLDTDKVVALISKDHLDWHELASFPKSDFPGAPSLIRIGKMNMTAEAKDNPGDLGAPGECTITDLMSSADSNPLGPFDFKANAHAATVKEFPFTAGSSYVACRIARGSDQGMTWGPALALIWDDRKHFMLVGARDAAGTFNVETIAGQKIINARLDPYPESDLPASKFRFSHSPAIYHLSADNARSAGEVVEADAFSDVGVQVHWRAELRDGSNYIRQTVKLASPDKTIPLTAIELADLHIPALATIGSCPGCPVAGNGMFAGVEIPGAQSEISPVAARIGFACKLDLSPQQSYDFGQVIGVWPEGQLRRSFLYYIERERARPSTPFLNYNCWYDLGYGVSAAGIVDAVSSFNQELVVKRGVPVLSYLVDDGWDDVKRGLWTENLKTFPGGLARLKLAMDKLGTHLGVWISPLGGYGGATERRDQARKMGLIPASGELDLSYPAYKRWFQDRCLELMREAGVNAFKWDRAGDGVTPHFMALLDVARTLRSVNPNIFINVTVGTWPSPFWLNHVDATWRNGTADVGWAGKGNDPDNPAHDREKWITFRDGSCRQCFVEKSPLYPLNSVMHHGIVNGRNFQGKDVAASGLNLRHESRSYFATGATLQELYLTPSLMTPQAWDDVADAAKWAHANADVLVDAHWVGGDPFKLEPYGYAAWNNRKATLMLRNPDDHPRRIDIDAAKVFELPPGAATHYRVVSPYSDMQTPISDMIAGEPDIITLQPFDVLVLDMSPLE